MYNNCIIECCKLSKVKESNTVMIHLQIHMLWNDHVRVCQNLNKLHIGCLPQRGKQLCWMFCNSHKSDIMKRHVYPEFFSELILKKICFFYFSHWAANPDHFHIYLLLWPAKNKVTGVFYLPIALFSGFCIPKWGHKLQSIQGVQRN